MGDPISRRYVGPTDIERLRCELSGRDLAIVGQVADLRLMSGRQICAIHFPVGDHDNELAAARACQRVLARLTAAGVLVRLERRVGGVRAGSAGYCYGLGSIGQRVLGLDGPRRRRYEPTERFLDHTLAIGQLVVSVTTLARSGAVEVLACQPEPRCHREFSGAGGRVVLRPDLFLAVGVGDVERHAFVEVDRGTESLPVVVAKCRTYDAYYRSGREQARHGVFPRVCWIVPDGHRLGLVKRAIARDRRLEGRLFTVTTTDDALGVLAGGST